ncbi:MAG: hypothetical protein IAE82_11535 [Opitutaceae bacterium]|nr:hypothetical protein [Opitutaceae bacterium]
MPSRAHTSCFPTRFTSTTLACLGLLIGGCAQVYTVKVDAIRTPELAPRRSYHLVPADPTRGTSDPSFAEARTMVDRALEMHGLMAASRPEWADMIIEIDYGIGQRRLVSAPDPSAHDAGAATVFLPDRTGDTVGSTTGTQVPGTAFTRVIAVWEKHLSLVACENSPTSSAPNHAGAELWRVDVSVQDSTPSIDGLIPVFAAALVDSVDGQSSVQTIKRISSSAAASLVARDDG